MPEARAAAATREHAYLELLSNGVRYVVRNPKILRLIVFISCALTVGGVLDEYWTLFATEAGLPRYSLGLFLAVLYAVPAVSSFVAHRFEALPARVFCGAVCACGGLLLAAAWQMQPASIVLLLVFTFLIQTTEVVFEGRLQHMIPSETRATVSSVRGFTIEVWGILAFLGMGSIVGEGAFASDSWPSVGCSWHWDSFTRYGRFHCSFPESHRSVRDVVGIYLTNLLEICCRTPRTKETEGQLSPPSARKSRPDRTFCTSKRTYRVAATERIHLAPNEQG